MKDLVWRAWWHWLKWPMPLWRVTGRARLVVVGRPVTLVGLRRSHHLAWAQGVRLGLEEPIVMEHFARAIRPGDVVLDVGSYLGAYSLLASRLVGEGGHVYAFEPDPRTRVHLAANLRANGVSNVTVVPAAVSDHVGTVSFHGSGRTTGRVLHAEGSTWSTTLDAFCAGLGVAPSVVKIDIEGGEAAALQPAASRRTLRDARVVLVEVHEFAGVDLETLALAAREVGKVPTHLEGRRGDNYNVAFA